MEPKVVIAQQLPDEANRLLHGAFSGSDIVRWHDEGTCTRDWLLDNAPGAIGLLVTLNQKVDESLLAAAGPTLKVISTMSAGIDHLDVAAIAARGIRIGYTPDCLVETVADTTVMLTLMASRRAGESMRLVLDGKWPSMPWKPLLLCGISITGKTIGFLGFGRIAQATLRRLMPYKPKRVIYCTSRVGQRASNDYVSLLDGPLPVEPAQSHQQLAEESDFLIISCSLNAETRGLVDDGFIRKMKPTAVVINSGRGPVVDSDALALALAEGRLLGAGLDVVDGEPNVTSDHPLVKQPRAVVLPHIGSATLETRNQMASEAVLNLIAGLKSQEMVSELSVPTQGKSAT